MKSRPAHSLGVKHRQERDNALALLNKRPPPDDDRCTVTYQSGRRCANGRSPGLDICKACHHNKTGAPPPPEWRKIAMLLERVAAYPDALNVLDQIEYDWVMLLSERFFMLHNRAKQD